MDMNEVLENLCIRDPRNPLFVDIYGDYELCELPEPRKDCYCDSCHSGKDRFALEVIRLLNRLAFFKLHYNSIYGFIKIP